MSKKLSIVILSTLACGFLLFFATSCSPSTKEPTTISSTLKSKETPTPSPSSTFEPTATPENTPLPINTPTPLPTELVEPSVTPTKSTTITPAPTVTQNPITMSTADPQKIPDMVVWGYPISSTQDVLAVWSGEAKWEPFSMKITEFWDYSPLSGRVLFSNAPTHAAYNNKSVTDLWVYNYETKQAEMLFPDHINGAALSGTIHPQTGTELLAVFQYTPDNPFDLYIMSDYKTVITTIHYASPYFSWSPDGQWLAFFRLNSTDDGIYIVPATGGKEIKIARINFLGSTYAKPVWAQEHQAIIDNIGTLSISFIDGSDPVDMPEGSSPYNMLWDPKTRQLLAGYEGGQDSPYEIRAFQLSEDLRSVTGDYVLAENQWLADWVIPGKTVLLANGQIIDLPG
ncbi:MAG: hypothetical protein IAF02_28395, partial [Anaerolineae bacterium]|nr:hypothetical protein [Anaerolineae bacterium]